ncbi:hypothetical protein F5887DRAFT_650365 [Amanita rubescens]|nr:hypothetical protein F5887DRAFT_650365 [Amanita rubescens]
MDQWQHSIDEQLEAMTSLAFINLNQRYVSRVPPTLFYSLPQENQDPVEAEDDLPSRMVSILSWIAICLVRDPQGDAVAAALSVRSGTIMLYLARTRGLPDERDIENGREFLFALRRAMAQKDPGSATDTLFKTTISISHRRFASKVGAIARMEPLARGGSSKVVERFNTIVDRWVASGGVENDTCLLNFARELRIIATESSGATVLKLVFRRLVDLIEKGLDYLSSGRDKQAWAHSYCRCALILVYSNFFAQFETEKPSAKGSKWYGTSADLDWILKLWRRLWRVARYRVDAWSFATYGFQFIQEALGEQSYAEFLHDGGNIHITWVASGQSSILPRNHGCPYPLPEPPLPLLQSTLEKYGYPSLDLDETNPFHQEFADSVRNLWPPGGAVPHLHCEIQLIKFFEQHETPVHRNYIGTSKLSCWACRAYIEQVNKKRAEAAEPWSILGTSNKANYEWLVPADSFGLSVVDLIREELKQALGSLSKTLSTRGISPASDESSSSDSDESRLPFLDVSSK